MQMQDRKKWQFKGHQSTTNASINIPFFGSLNSTNAIVFHPQKVECLVLHLHLESSSVAPPKLQTMRAPTPNTQSNHIRRHDANLPTPVFIIRPYGLHMQGQHQNRSQRINPQNYQEVLNLFSMFPTLGLCGVLALPQIGSTMEEQPKQKHRVGERYRVDMLQKDIRCGRDFPKEQQSSLQQQFNSKKRFIQKLRLEVIDSGEDQLLMMFNPLEKFKNLKLISCYKFTYMYKANIKLQILRQWFEPIFKLRLRQPND